jgi:hypothetical protein
MIYFKDSFQEDLRLYELLLRAQSYLEECKANSKPIHYWELGAIISDIEYVRQILKRCENKEDLRRLAYDEYHWE